jgi:hypothetical protein
MKSWYQKQTFFSSETLGKIEAWVKQESTFIFGEC